MDELVTWLRAQLDARERELNEDEQVARRAGWSYPTWSYDRETFTVSSTAYTIAARKERNDLPLNDVDGEHIARWDPDRVLREVVIERAEINAKRRILDLHDGGHDGSYPDGYYAAKDEVIRLLALPMAGRDGYREDWRP